MANDVSIHSNTIENTPALSNNFASFKIFSLSDFFLGRKPSKVNLEDGFEAEDLKVIVNAYKPESATIVAYAKVLSPDDSASFDDRDYILLEQETPASSHSLNEDDYREYIFKSSGDSIDYTDDNGTNYKKFKTFAVKLALLSTSTTNVPKVSDLRAIALDE